MESRNEEEWIKILDCPHQVQDFVGCNDESAKTLAEIVYNYARDDDFREKLRDGAVVFPSEGHLVRLARFLADYDVYPQQFYEGLVLVRYDRPQIGDEKKGFAGFFKYLQDTPNVRVHVPCYVPDVVRAFGEFADIEVDSEIIANCTGALDDPDFPCSICGKFWERTWDN